MVISKEKCYDFYGHPTSISGHNIIGFIAVWYAFLVLHIMCGNYNSSESPRTRVRRISYIFWLNELNKILL